MFSFPEGRPGRQWFLFALFLIVLTLRPVPGYAVTEVGLLTWKTSELFEKAISAFQEQIRVESPHVVLIRRDAGLSRTKFETYLEEFSSRQVKVQVVLGSDAARMVHARDAGDVLPTVALCVADPQSLGFEGPEENSACPLTGVTYSLPLRKHLSLYAHLYPEARSLAFLYDPGGLAGSCVELKEIRRVGRSLGLKVLALPVESGEKLQGRVKEAVAGADMIVLATNKLLYGNAGKIIRWAGDVPVFSLAEEGVPTGAVAALYADRGNLGRAAARQVRQILDGTPARAIPFYYPQTEKLSVNLASARRWGIMIPRELMERPSVAWRSSNQPEWYGEDGSLRREFRLRNDPDGRSFLRIGLICQDAEESRPFLAGIVKGLQLGRSNYEVEMYDIRSRKGRASEILGIFQREVDLIMAVGEKILRLVEDRSLPVPVVFTGALVSEARPLGWQNRRMTGSTYYLDNSRQVALMEGLFGRDVPYLLVNPFFPPGRRAENCQLYLEMLTSGLDVERVRLSAALTPRNQAERLFRALSERIRRADGTGPPPVLVVPNGGDFFRCLPGLGEMLVSAGFSVPIYVTSTWGIRWGGTVAPDVDPEEAGMVAGRYVTQILEQGIYPEDLPIWGGKTVDAICVSRRWKEISNWTVPQSWKGRVREIVTEAMQ